MKITLCLLILLVVPSAAFAKPPRHEKQLEPGDRLLMLHDQLSLTEDETKKVGEILVKTTKACQEGETFKAEDCKLLREQEPKEIEKLLDVKQKKLFRKLNAANKKQTKNVELQSPSHEKPTDLERESRRQEMEARRAARRRQRSNRRPVY